MPAAPDSRAHRNALARRRRLLADEHYGPLYARATRAQAAAIDARVEAGDTAGAKALLDAQDSQRRAAARARYRARLERQVVEHLRRQLAGYSHDDSTLEQGVAIMTYAELRATLKWSSGPIRRAAGDGSNIRPDLSHIPRNPWWYH